MREVNSLIFEIEITACLIPVNIVGTDLHHSFFWDKRLYFVNRRLPIILRNINVRKGRVDHKIPHFAKLLPSNTDSTSDRNAPVLSIFGFEQLEKFRIFIKDGLLIDTSEFDRRRISGFFSAVERGDIMEGTALFLLNLIHKVPVLVVVVCSVWLQPKISISNTPLKLEVCFFDYLEVEVWELVLTVLIPERSLKVCSPFLVDESVLAHDMDRCHPNILVFNFTRIVFFICLLVVWVDFSIVCGLTLTAVF